MLYTARTEAQGAADAAALAGASAYLGSNPSTVPPIAKDRAKRFAAMNRIRNQPVDTALVYDSTLVYQGVEVRVEVIPDSLRVRVWTQRQGLPLWFAGCS